MTTTVDKRPVQRHKLLSCYAVATRTDFLVRDSRTRTSDEEIGACSHGFTLQSL